MPGPRHEQVVQGGTKKVNIEGLSAVGLFLSSSGCGSIRTLVYVSPGLVEILPWDRGLLPTRCKIGLWKVRPIDINAPGPETSEDDSRVEFLLRTWSRCLCQEPQSFGRGCARPP